MNPYILGTYTFPNAVFCPPWGFGFINVSPPIGVGEGDGEMAREEADREGGEAAKNGTERSSGKVWKNSGANVVPKNAPAGISAVLDTEVRNKAWSR